MREQLLSSIMKYAEIVFFGKNTILIRVEDYDYLYLVQSY